MRCVVCLAQGDRHDVERDLLGHPDHTNLAQHCDESHLKWVGRLESSQQGTQTVLSNVDSTPPASFVCLLQQCLGQYVQSRLAVNHG